ncbi:MAG: hypothetical protein A4E28_01400 [Methanocella sp. PtaU1.Bin125]|nr:MAG: hypothetical protein A4E28_01400 [Methanocella sp. PtaU1.Bin125]
MKVDKVIIAGAAIIVVLAVILVMAGACGGCALLASLPGTHGPLDRIEHETRSDTHAAADSIELVVSTIGGNVEIREWTEDSVKVTYDVHAPEGHLGDVLTSTKDTKEGNATSITAEVRLKDDRFFNMGNRGADVTVMVPRGSTYSLHLNTLGGDIRVPPLQGSSVYMDTLGGKLYLNGGRYDTVTLTTMGGDIRATYEATNATFRTMGGDIEIDTTQTAGILDASTAGGDIDVKLPSGTQFTIDAGTMGGRVRHGYIHMTPTTESDTRLVGQTEGGAGNLIVKLQTTGGNIDISY